MHNFIAFLRRIFTGKRPAETVWVYYIKTFWNRSPVYRIGVARTIDAVNYQFHKSKGAYRIIHVVQFSSMASAVDYQYSILDRFDKARVGIMGLNDDMEGAVNRYYFQRDVLEVDEERFRTGENIARETWQRAVEAQKEEMELDLTQRIQTYQQHHMLR